MTKATSTAHHPQSKGMRPRKCIGVHERSKNQKQDTPTRPTSLETLKTSLTRQNGRRTALRKDRVEIRYFG
jgi:hypothetical protein